MICRGVDLSEFDPLSNSQPLATSSTNADNLSHLYGSSYGTTYGSGYSTSNTADRSHARTLRSYSPPPRRSESTSINSHQRRDRSEHELTPGSTLTRPMSAASFFDTSSPTTIPLLRIPSTPLYSRTETPPNDLNKEEIGKILRRVKTDIDHISRLLT